MPTKSNPGVFDCYKAACADEPIFVILGRDPAGPATLRFWRQERQRIGKDESQEDQERLTAALDDANEMELWREANLDFNGEGTPLWKLDRITNEGRPIRVEDVHDPLGFRDALVDLLDDINGSKEPHGRNRRAKKIERMIEALDNIEPVLVTRLLDGTIPEPERGLTDILRDIGRHLDVTSRRETAILNKLNHICWCLDNDQPITVPETWVTNEVPLDPALMETVYTRDVKVLIHGKPMTIDQIEALIPAAMRDRQPDDVSLGVYGAGGFCPTCGAGNYGGPCEPRVGRWGDGRTPDHVEINYLEREEATDLLHDSATDDPNNKDWRGERGEPADRSQPSHVRPPVVDEAPRDLAHSPEVPPHRFAEFRKGERYAYARGLEVNPVHLPIVLDEMAADGWELLAVFGATDSQHVGFIFERRPEPILLQMPSVAAARDLVDRFRREFPGVAGMWRSPDLLELPEGLDGEIEVHVHATGPKLAQRLSTAAMDALSTVSWPAAIRVVGLIDGEPTRTVELRCGPATGCEEWDRGRGLEP